MKNWYVRIFLSMLLMQSKNNSDIELLCALHSRNSTTYCISIPQSYFSVKNPHPGLLPATPS